MIPDDGGLFGGTRLSGPQFNVGSSIPCCRGLKCRAESGAKAPHSIWSPAIYRRCLVKALAFTTLPSARTARRRPIGVEPDPPIHAMEGPACRGRSTRIDAPSPSTGHDKRAPPIFGGTCLSRPLCDCWTKPIGPSSGTTSVPLGFLEGPACQVRFSSFPHRGPDWSARF
ncbi:MAG: hypothetical protein KatS3mg112_0008 [Thermogutta sp.]|nr:MAG: hypothetical protein KatS3mg112_0008 [Thermogutta sp.]